MERSFHVIRFQKEWQKERLLVSSDEIMFYLIDPKTGVVIEPAHALEGQSMAGKIFDLSWRKRKQCGTGGRSVPVK